MTTPIFNNLTAKYLNNGRKGLLGIVLHDTVGTDTHNDTLYLSNPSDGRKLSVDFTVEKDGSIWKLNPDLQKYYCNHAGSSTSWLGFHNAQVNAVTVGIEIAQKGNLTLAPIYTEPQVKLVAQLCAWLNKQYDIKNSGVTDI